MKVVFVHGLGGEDGGRLERSLLDCVQGGCHDVVPIRWASGNLKKIAGGALWNMAKEAMTEHNPWRLAIRVIVAIQQEGHQSYDSALANATHASQRVMGLMKFLAKSDQEFSVIGFSLGGRILMSALRTMGDPGIKMRRAVFAAAAVSSSSFAHLVPTLLCDGRIVNVHSDGDDVLASLYPLVHGLDGAAGTQAVAVPGVENFKVDAGHLSYGKLAERLMQLATT